MKITILLSWAAKIFGCILLLSLFTCKKSSTVATPGYSSVASTGSSFHMDNINQANQLNRTLLFTPQANNAQQFLSVSSTSAGIGVYSVTGFNLMGIDKAAGIKNMHYYITDSVANYEVEQAICATTDNGGNVWVGGYAATAKEDYTKPFLVKLDANGNILLTKNFSKKESQYVYKNYRADGVKVLNNGDVLLLMVSNYDSQLIRMQSNGTVLWDKEFTVADASVFNLAQGHNSFITENAQGDIFFLSIETNIANGGTYLTRITAAGSLVYSVGYPNIGNTLYIQLKFLSTGELLLFGQNDIIVQPFIIKINPADGSILLAKEVPVNVAGNSDMTINDIVEAKGQLKAAFTAGDQYSVITMDYSFNILSSVITLAKSSGSVLQASLIYDSATGALFHVVDEPGPTPGSFLQFLRTDVNGKSCHTYTTMPIAPQLSVFDPGSVHLPMQVTNDIPGDGTVAFTKTTIYVTTADACNQ